MPHASHRLDLLLVPADAGTGPGADGLDALVLGWKHAGILAEDLRAGPAAETVLPGGFARVRLDRPPSPVLYANQQGGFRVRCPVHGQGLVRDFGVAMAAWRRVGPRELRCPSCGQVHDLDGLDFAPPAAFGTAALVFVDARGASLTDEALARVAEALGPTRMVWRRVSG